MNLFKMHQHVGDKAFEEALGSVLELVRVYWQVRQWLEAPDEGKAPFMVDINGWRIKAKP